MREPVRDTSSFEPLRVTARLAMPVVLSDPFLPLDGILHYMAHRDKLGPQMATLPGEARFDGRGVGALPLAKERDRSSPESIRQWFYKCSFAVWPEAVADGRSHWSKQFRARWIDLIDTSKGRSSVDHKSGPYKSYRMPLFTRHALSVSWHCVGDRSEVERLLRFCGFIGKKTSQGWGGLMDGGWTVEPWSEDLSVRDRAGEPMRAVPSDDPKAILYGYRPPYWLPANQAPCLLPSAR